MGTTDISILKSQCDALPECAGFNSNGFLKRVGRDQLADQPGFPGGIYLKRTEEEEPIRGETIEATPSTTKNRWIVPAAIGVSTLLVIAVIVFFIVLNKRRKK